MSAGVMTPQEAAETALTSAAKGVKIEGVPVVDMVVRAIELYEASRKRVQLTPEQAKAFEERVDELSVEWQTYNAFRAERIFGKGVSRPIANLFFGPNCFNTDDLRQLAAVLEALADNLERFPV